MYREREREKGVYIYIYKYKLSVCWLAGRTSFVGLQSLHDVGVNCLALEVQKSAE